MRLLIIFFVLTNVNSSINENIEKLYHSKNNKFSVLIFTKTNGFVHGKAIKEGIKLITNIGRQNKFNVDHTNISSFFIVKEIYKLLQYLSTSETIIIDHNWDEEWDWISRPEDLP